MKTDLELVEEELSTLRMTQMRLELENFKANLTPMINAAIGKTYVYRNNSYGSGGKWDTFRKLLSVVFSEYNAWIIFEQNQISSDGVARLETVSELIQRSARALPFLERNWMECEHMEYAKNREATLRELADPARYRHELSK